MRLLRLRDPALARRCSPAGSLGRAVLPLERLRDARPVLDPQRVDRRGCVRSAGSLWSWGRLRATREVAVTARSLKAKRRGDRWSYR